MVNLLVSTMFFLSLVGVAFGAFPKKVSPVQRTGFMKGFLESVGEAKKHLVSAAVARSTSILGMYPVDTIKTRIQLGQSNPFSLSGLYRKCHI